MTQIDTKFGGFLRTEKPVPQERRTHAPVYTPRTRTRLVQVSKTQQHLCIRRRTFLPTIVDTCGIFRGRGFPGLAPDRPPPLYDGWHFLYACCCNSGGNWQVRLISRPHSYNFSLQTSLGPINGPRSAWVRGNTSGSSRSSNAPSAAALLSSMLCLSKVNAAVEPKLATVAKIIIPALPPWTAKRKTGQRRVGGRYLSTYFSVEHIRADRTASPPGCVL